MTTMNQTWRRSLAVSGILEGVVLLALFVSLSAENQMFAVLLVPIGVLWMGFSISLLIRRPRRIWREEEIN
jgi:hypothetical protein